MTRRHFVKQFVLLACLLCLLCFSAAAEDAVSAQPEENTQVTHYLLLGEDSYADEVSDEARTDTIVLLSLDAKYNRVIVTSILRDCMIPNKRGENTKINLLYKAYGFDGLCECVGRQLGIEIEGAVLVNFENVKPVIDALGGVDIEIDKDELAAIRRILLGKDPNMPTHTGLVHMTGRIALAYMRDRSSSSGDFDRTQRQRKVVSQLFDKCRSLSLPELIGIYNQVSHGMKMSLSALDVLSAFSQGFALLTNGADFVEFRIPRKGYFTYSALGSSSALDVNWKRNREFFHDLLNTAPAAK